MRATVLAVPSTSTPGTEYRVWVGADGPIFCDCRGFRLRKGPVESRKWCVHMRGIAADSSVLATARTIAASTGTPNPKAGQPVQHSNRAIRFIEIVEGTTESWQPVPNGNLSRFNNLEVS